MMKVAEELYQEGFISYPRTETDCFDPAYDLKVVPLSLRPAALPLPLQSFLLPSRLQSLHHRAFPVHPCTGRVRALSIFWSITNKIHKA